MICTGRWLAWVRPTVSPAAWLGVEVNVQVEGTDPAENVPNCAISLTPLGLPPPWLVVVILVQPPEPWLIAGTVEPTADMVKAKSATVAVPLVVSELVLRLLLVTAKSARGQ